MTAEELETLKKLEQAATKGPWFFHDTAGTDFTAISTRAEYPEDIDMEHEVIGSSEWLRAKYEDMELIAAMRNHLPALLDVAEKMQRLSEWATKTTPMDHIRACDLRKILEDK